MKILGCLLILIVVFHSQCLIACPIELFFSASQPPCHHAHKSESHQPNACGFGVVVQFKLKAAPQNDDLVYEAATAALPDRFHMPQAQQRFTPALQQSLSPPLFLKTTLRI
jgi:hypothetical protein